MKKIYVLVIVIMLCCGCSLMVEEIPPLETTKDVIGYQDAVKETEVANEIIQKEENASDNEIFAVLDEIKNVHPGTAGCSIQVLYAAGHLLNVCRSKLPLDTMAGKWIEEQDKLFYDAIKESFMYLFENLKMIKETDAKKLFEDNDIKDMYNSWDDTVFNNATDVIGTVVGKIG